MTIVSDDINGIRSIAIVTTQYLVREGVLSVLIEKKNVLFISLLFM